MSFNSPNWNLPWHIYLILSALLVIAIAPMPYGYYKFVKIAVCLSSIAIAYNNFSSEDGANSIWTWVFVLFAILFNPFISFHITKDIWQVLDAISAALFGYLAYKTKMNKS